MKAVDRYGDTVIVNWINNLQTPLNGDGEPKSFAEAQKSYAEELKSLEHHKTWEDTDHLPQGRRALGSRWVFKMKKLNENEILPETDWILRPMRMEQ